MTAEVLATRSFAARTRRTLEVIVQTSPTSRDAIVVASFDRAGSTLVYDDLPVLCLRYEALWNSALSLSEFCGLDMTFPSRRPRAPTWVEPNLLESACSNYESIGNDLAELLGIFVAGSNFDTQMQDTGTWKG